MKKVFLPAFISLMSGFVLFALLAPLNQSFAAGLGQNCSFGTRIPTVSCDSNLTCDTSADTSSECELGRACRGVCRATCGVYQGGPANGGCPSTDYCEAPSSCVGTGNCRYGYNGVCKPTNAPHVAEGGFCQIFDQNNTQGNCLGGLTCNVSQDSTFNGTGVCLPNNYTCSPALRNTGNYIDCPNTTICGSELYKNGICAGTAAQRQNPVCGKCFFSSDFYTSCSCENRPPNNIGSGKNRFTCTDNTGATASAYCPRSEQGCWDDVDNATMSHRDVFQGRTLHGIQCLTRDEKNRTGANAVPPAAPCNKTVDGNCTEILTAFGPVGTDPAAFITRFFGILLGAAGAIALLLIMRAGYRIMTARGNPEGIKEGREQIVAAIVGLMFIIFSFVLLEVIGVDLLRLPNFN